MRTAGLRGCRSTLRRARCRTSEPKLVSNCVKCGKCARHCPQPHRYPRASRRRAPTFPAWPRDGRCLRPSAERAPHDPFIYLRWNRPCLRQNRGHSRNYFAATEGRLSWATEASRDDSREVRWGIRALGTFRIDLHRRSRRSTGHGLWLRPAALLHMSRNFAERFRSMLRMAMPRSTITAMRLMTR